MNRKRVALALGAVGVVGVLAMVGAVQGRGPLSRLAPIHHTGELLRIAPSPVESGGTGYELFFTDGFHCTGDDASFAALREGDTVKIRALHDVAGTPLIGADWWECTDARLEQLVAQTSSL
jgi:hypothetical protein